MTWTRLDDGIFDHPKMLRAGDDAAHLYVRALVYCNRLLTDGRVHPEALPVIFRHRAVRDLAARLVSVGAWDVHPEGGWTVHDFHDLNPTADEVRAKRDDIRAKRSAAGKQGGIASGKARSNEANPKQPPSTFEAKVEQPDEANTKPRPVPSRPEENSLSLTPPAPATSKKPPREKKPADPPPFPVGEAFEALAVASSGRFVAGTERDWTKGVRIAVAKAVRAYPDLALWRRLGRWLASGGDAFRGSLGPAWAASNALADAMARAGAWEAQGGGPVPARGVATPPPLPLPRTALPERPPPPVALPRPPDPAKVAAARALLAEARATAALPLATPEAPCA